MSSSPNVHEERSTELPREVQPSDLPLYNTASHDRQPTSPHPTTSRQNSLSHASAKDDRAYESEKEGAVTENVNTLTPGEQGKYDKLIGHVVRLGMIALILGWWISGIVVPATRTTKRLIVSTLFGWFFILLLVSHYVPISPLGRPVGAVWKTAVSKPFFLLPSLARYALGVAALLALIFGSAFGFSLKDGESYSQRGRAIFGIAVSQAILALTSSNIRKVQWDTVIVGLCFQQILALFVFKTSAGLDLFLWIATLAQDFLNQAQAGVSFFVGDGIANEHYFFFSTLAAIVFFIAFVYLLYYWGVMQWAIKRFAWFFFRTMRVSGAEAVVATSSPFIGQGESACLVKPYVAAMTPSELHLTMTSGFSTISGSVFAAYVAFGAPAQYLITSSVMSIPASISISKLRYPELGEPLTKGRVVVAREKDDASSALHAFSNGAWFGLRVAGLILCNLLTILSLLSAVNGLLTYIGKNFGIHQLTLTLIMSYVFYPIAWLMGVPEPDMLTVAGYMGERIIANEFVAYSHMNDVQTGVQKGHILPPHSHLIAVFALCGFANVSSLGIQIGVLSGLAQNQKPVLARIGWSALLCGYLSTIQTAAIAGLLG